jgi:hypothetical protein
MSADIAEDRIDRLHSRRVRRIHHARPRILRLTPFRGLHHTQIGGVILESNRQRRHIFAGRRNGKRILDSQRRLQDRHDPDRPDDSVARLDLADHAIHFPHLLRLLDLRNQIRSGLSPTTSARSSSPSGNWLMRTMRSHDPEIDRPQSVSHQDAGGIFLGAMHGIFQIENHGIRRMQRGVDVVLRLRTRQIQTRATQPVLRVRAAAADAAPAASVCPARSQRAAPPLRCEPRSQTAARLHRESQLARASLQVRPEPLASVPGSPSRNRAQPATPARSRPAAVARLKGDVHSPTELLCPNGLPRQNAGT